MDNRLYIALFLFSVLLASISQILLKKSANKVYGSVVKEYLNPQVILAYMLFFGSTIITVFAYRGVALSLGPVLESTGYIYIALLSYLFLKERLTRKKLFGTALVILGILVFSLH